LICASMRPLNLAGFAIVMLPFLSNSMAVVEFFYSI
jgi:hypothetical protein